MKTYEVDYEVERGEEVIHLRVRGTVSPYVPAKTWGPPENCYPAEGGEVEIEVILEGEKGDNEWKGELTDSEREAVEEMLTEQAQDDDDGPDPDDYYDSRFDD